MIGMTLRLNAQRKLGYKNFMAYCFAKKQAKKKLP
jgi:hypothetical protein